MDLSNFQKTVFQSVDREELGSVRDAMKGLYGETAKLAPHAGSMTSSKKFTLKVYEESNPLEYVNLVCSASVSEKLRSKEIGLRQVLDFPIIKHTVGPEYPNAGLVVNIVAMPTTIVDGVMPSVSINDVAKVSFTPTFNPSELIAL